MEYFAVFDKAREVKTVVKQGKCRVLDPEPFDFVRE